MNQWMLTLWRWKFFIKSSLTSVQRSFMVTNNDLFYHLFFCLCYYWLIDWMPLIIMNAFWSPFLLFMLLLINWLNAADHYEITKFDLYKDDICLIYLSCFDLNLRSYEQLFVLVLTLTYVLIDNILSLFFFLAIQVYWKLSLPIMLQFFFI